MSSRLAVDQRGRTIVVITSPTPFLYVGQRFPVVDSLLLNSWDTSRGRPPTAREQAEARPPYRSDVGLAPAREAPNDDELLDEQAALEACMREQQREPVDLIGRAA
jgi:hypothetical protein